MLNITMITTIYKVRLLPRGNATLRFLEILCGKPMLKTIAKVTVLILGALVFTTLFSKKRLFSRLKMNTIAFTSMIVANLSSAKKRPRRTPLLASEKLARRQP